MEAADARSCRRSARSAGRAARRRCRTGTSRVGAAAPRRDAARTTAPAAARARRSRRARRAPRPSPRMAIANVTSGASSSWPAGPPAPTTPAARPRSAGAVAPADLADQERVARHRGAGREHDQHQEDERDQGVDEDEQRRADREQAGAAGDDARRRRSGAPALRPPAGRRRRRAARSAAASAIDAMPSPVAVLSGDRNMPNEARLPAISAVSAVADPGQAPAAALIAATSRSGRRTRAAGCARRRRAPRRRTSRSRRRCRPRSRSACGVEPGELGARARGAAPLGVGDAQPVQAGDEAMQRARRRRASSPAQHGSRCSCRFPVEEAALRMGLRPPSAAPASGVA